MQALLDDLARADSLYESMYNSSVNSANSAMEENEIYMQSLEARIKLVRVEIEKLALAIGEAFLTEGMVQALQLFTKLVQAVSKFISIFGALPTLFGTTIIGLGLFSKRFREVLVQLGSYVSKTVESTRAIIKNRIETEKLTASKYRLSRANQNAVNYTGSLTANLNKNTKEIEANRKAEEQSARTRRMAGVGMGTLAVASIGVGFALEFLLARMEETRQKQEELRAENEQLRKSYTDNAETIDNLVDRFSFLYSHIENGANPNTEEYQEYLKVQNQLAELMPQLVQKEDEFGNKIIGSSEAVRAKIEALKEQIAYQRQLNNEENRADREKALKEAKEDAKKSLKEIDDIIQHSSDVYSHYADKFRKDGFDLGFEDGIQSANDMYEALNRVREALQNPPEQGFSEKGINRLNMMKSTLETNIRYLLEYETDLNNAMLTIKSSTVDAISEAIISIEGFNKESRQLAENILLSSVVFMDSEETLSKFEETVNNLKVNDRFVDGLNELQQKISDMNNYSGQDIEEFREQFSSSFNEITESILKASGLELDSEAYNALKRALNDLIGTQYNYMEQVLETAEANKISTEEAKSRIAMINGESVAYSEASEEIAKYLEGLRELSSASEMILGISSSQVDETEKLVAVYKTLSETAERLGGISKLSAQQQESLAEAFQKLSAIYPHLVENNELRIKNILEENNANKILLETYENVAEGHYTEEQKRTLANAEGTYARIQQIINEVTALQNLQDEIVNTTLTAKQMSKAISDGMLPSLGSSFYLPNTSDSADLLSKSIVGKRTELEKLYGLLNGVTGTLNGYNRAIEENSKKSGANSKSTKESIYVTDKFRQELERLNLEIKKHQELQKKYSDYSEEYRKSLQQQIRLEQQKLQLIQKQAKTLDSQIKSGQIQQTGTISGQSSTINLSGWNGRISSGYGYRTLNGQREFHRGIDIAMPKGTRLDSNVSGRVIASGSATSQGYHASYGNIVVVQDERGYKHLYAHLDKAIAKLGETITVGTHIGNIGSTGNSTGPHLHYEVNVNGKTIDPSDFINDAKSGIVSVVNTGQEAIDKAKSDLLSLQGDIISQEQLIAELQNKIVESYLSSYERRRSIFDSEIAYEKEKIQQLDTTSSRYARTVELMTLYMQNKQKVNNQELSYLDNAIKSGKYQGAILDQLKDRYKQLTTEILANTNAIRQNNEIKIQGIMTRYDETIDDLYYTLERSRVLSSLMTKGSADYNNEVEYQIRLLERVREETLNKRTALMQLLQTEELSTEQVKAYKEQLEDLSVEYWNLKEQIVSANKELEEANLRVVEEIADKLIDSYKQYLEEKKSEHIKSLDDELKREEKRHEKLMKNYKDEMDLFRKNVQERLDLLDREESERDYNMEIDELESERRKLVDQLNLLSFDDSYEAKSKRKKLQEDLDRIDKDIAERRHDREVELQRQSLNDMLKLKEEEIAELEQKADERLENERESIERQKEYWEQYYEDMLNDERRFAKIREDIVAGNLDALESEFKDYVEEMKATMPELEWSLNSTMQNVGSTIRQNVIDNLEEAIEKLKEFRHHSELGVSEYSKSSFSRDSSVGKNTLDKADAQVLAGKFLIDRLIHQTDIHSRKEIIKDIGYDLAKKGRQGGSSIPTDVSFDEYVNSQLDKSERGQLSDFLLDNVVDLFQTPSLQDYIRKYAKSIASYDVGGMTPKFSGRGIDGKGGRLSVIHPEEIINNPIDSKNLVKTSLIMERIAKLVSPLTNKGLDISRPTGGDSYLVQFGDIYNATPNQAETFGQKFINTIKRGKGGKY